jgi:DNA-binding MarR family transcriptional regulator
MDDREIDCPYCVKPEASCECRWFPQECTLQPKAVLTPKQARVLLFIAARQKAGAPPSYREIAEYLGVVSPNTVTGYLDTIEHKGYIRREKNCARAITILALPQ